MERLLICGALLTILYAASVAGCGQGSVPPKLGRAYIVGGKEATPHSWPWMVSVQSNRIGHFCGGSLLNHRWILTAAHCVAFYKDRPEWINVGVGYHDLDNLSSKSQKVQVTKVEVHDGWNEQTMANDIALLELAENVPYSNAVQPVCLPPAQHEWQKNTMFVVTGWGLTDETNVDPSPTLQQVQVPLVETEVCNGLAWLKGAVDPQTMLCAGYDEGGYDSCQMDSGGPLVTRVDDHWQQAGVVSWGINCGAARRPGVYAHVSKYVPWIEKLIN